MYTVKFSGPPAFTLSAPNKECLNGIIAAHAVMNHSWGLEYIDEMNDFEVFNLSGNILSNNDLKRIWSGYTSNGPSDYLPGQVWAPEDKIEITGTMTPTKKPIKRYIILEPTNMTLGHVGYVLNYDTDQFWQCFLNAVISMKTTLVTHYDYSKHIFKNVQIYDYGNDNHKFKREFAKLHQLRWD